MNKLRSKAVPLGNKKTGQKLSTDFCSVVNIPSFPTNQSIDRSDLES